MAKDKEKRKKKDKHRKKKKERRRKEPELKPYRPDQPQNLSQLIGRTGAGGFGGSGSGASFPSSGFPGVQLTNEVTKLGTLIGDLIAETRKKNEPPPTTSSATETDLGVATGDDDGLVEMTLDGDDAIIPPSPQNQLLQSAIRGTYTPPNQTNLISPDTPVRRIIRNRRTPTEQENAMEVTEVPRGTKRQNRPDDEDIPLYPASTGALVLVEDVEDEEESRPKKRKADDVETLLLDFVTETQSTLAQDIANQTPVKPAEQPVVEVLAPPEIVTERAIALATPVKAKDGEGQKAEGSPSLALLERQKKEVTKEVMDLARELQNLEDRYKVRAEKTDELIEDQSTLFDEDREKKITEEMAVLENMRKEMVDTNARLERVRAEMVRLKNEIASFESASKTMDEIFAPLVPYSPEQNRSENALIFPIESGVKRSFDALISVPPNAKNIPFESEIRETFQEVGLVPYYATPTMPKEGGVYGLIGYDPDTGDFVTDLASDVLVSSKDGKSTGLTAEVRVKKRSKK
jgi:hypothetical protein